MMEMKADKNPRIALTLDGRAEITFTTDKASAIALEALKDKELLVKVASFREKRSISQNAYMWVLIGQLAKAIGIPKTEAYRNYIKEYGIYEIMPIKKEASERFMSAWRSNGMGWIAERVGDSKIGGYDNVIAYYGSSSYDTAQLSKVIDAVVRDCEEQGIPTLSIEEIKSLDNENDG